MTRITVADTILKAGEPWGHTPVRFELVDSAGDPVSPAYVTDTGVLVEPFTTATDADGTFTVQLDPTDAIAPTGCFYGVTVGDVGPIVIRGDQGDGSLRSLRASTPTVLGSTATLDGLADVDITGRVDGSVVEWDTTSSTWIMGTGGGGGGAPSGPAGGVLSGTYPNPGFAADMATQAELDAHTGGTDPHGDRAYAAGLVDDLSGVTNAATARTNLGLGTAATAALDTDGTLAANSDTRVASQKAVKTYADQLIASADAMVYKGVVDCSTNPNYPAADRGHTYRVSVAGKIGGASGTNVEAGDLLLCLTDGTSAGTQAAVGSSWSIVQTNIDGAVVGPASAISGHVAVFSGITGKVVADGGALGTVAALASDTDGALAANSDSNVATQRATKTYADLKLAKASNLSDVANASTARTNLGLGSLATLSTITTSEITDGTIVNADISASAAIAASKISGLGTVSTLASDTDGTLAANSDSNVATQKATKTYADGKVPKSTVTAKGDLIAATGSAAVTNVAVGANNKVLLADSSATAGVAWGYPVPPFGSPKNGSTSYFAQPGYVDSGTSTAGMIANVCIYYPLYLATAMTCDQIAVEQITAAAAGKLMRIGLIAADKYWQPTGSALIDSGNFAADGANGVKTYTPGSPVALTPGRYLGVIHSDGAPVLRAVLGSCVACTPFGTSLGATPAQFAWRVSKALGAIDATAWDTVSGAGTSGNNNPFFMRFSDPAP